MNTAVASRSPAGFWKRYVAYFIDVLLIYLVIELLSRVFFSGSDLGDTEQVRSLMTTLQNPEASPQDQTAVLLHATDLLWKMIVVSSLIYAVIGGAYFVICESSAWQATLGKRLIGIKVVDADGARIGPARAIGRFVAASLSWLTMNIGHALAAWTPDRRALHDMIADTRVENADPTRTQMPVWGWVIIGLNAVLFLGVVVSSVMALTLAFNQAAQF